MQKDNGKEHNNNDETSDLVINDFSDKSEGQVKTISNDDEATVLFQMILDTCSATKKTLLKKLMR